LQDPKELRQEDSQVAFGKPPGHREGSDPQNSNRNSDGVPPNPNQKAQEQQGCLRHQHDSSTVRVLRENDAQCAEEGCPKIAC
jgi:hypothetical protein